MYQVYSQQQPGRPRWALVACALLLLLAVAAAAALIESRNRRRHVELGETRAYPAAGLSARVPKGWEGIPQEDWPPGVVAGFAEPGLTSGLGRRLFLFRGPPDPTGLPSTHAATAVIQTDITSGPAPLTVQFDGTSSAAEDDRILDYFWDFGSGETSRSPNPQHTFRIGGTFTVRLRVVTFGGVEASTSTTITIEATNASLQFSGSQFATLPVSVLSRGNSYRQLSRLAPHPTQSYPGGIQPRVRHCDLLEVIIQMT